MTLPLAIDLYSGLGGWASGFLAEGYDVIGFDNGDGGIDLKSYPGQLVFQDILTLHGKQFKSATIIVASPPCQKYSYMALPWSRAKKLMAWYREDPERIKELNTLFDVCFRIQREASEAAGHKIPMIVENERGAQPWVGRAKWHYGSYYLWGDVPALMPITRHRKLTTASWSRYAKTGEVSPHWTMQVEELKNPGNSKGKFWNERPFSHWGDKGSLDGIKIRAEGHYTRPNSGRDWFDMGPAAYGSNSSARKQASAMIAKIPFELASYIARVFK